jgi:hypothetical protein
MTKKEQGLALVPFLALNFLKMIWYIFSEALRSKK